MRIKRIKPEETQTIKHKTKKNSCFSLYLSFPHIRTCIWTRLTKQTLWLIRHTSSVGSFCTIICCECSERRIPENKFGGMSQKCSSGPFSATYVRLMHTNIDRRQPRSATRLSVYRHISAQLLNATQKTGWRSGECMLHVRTHSSTYPPPAQQHC